MKSFQLYCVLINHLVLSKCLLNLFKTTSKFLPNHEYLRQNVCVIISKGEGLRMGLNLAWHGRKRSWVFQLLLLRSLFAYWWADSSIV